MLSFKVWTVATALFTAISYVLCVLGGLLLPGLPIPHRTLELLLPGFAWISTSSFLIGLVETFGYGLYAGGLFVLLHNFFARRWGTPIRAGSNLKAA
jgi:hypothetical protein